MLIVQFSLSTCWPLLLLPAAPLSDSTHGIPHECIAVSGLSLVVTTTEAAEVGNPDTA
jgi:hypothetical protein